MLLNFSLLSDAENWTAVFCSLPWDGALACGAAANKAGYEHNCYIWTKENLHGASHAGGPNQAVMHEFIVVVFYHSSAIEKTLLNHMTLLAQKDILDKVCKDNKLCIRESCLVFGLKMD